VVLADLSLRPEAQALVEKYKSLPRAMFHKTDVKDWSQLSKLFSTTTAEFDSLDLVCPGAGVFEPSWSNFYQPPGASNSASKDSPDGFGHYATLDINLTHPIRATQLAISEFLNPAKNGAKASPTNPKRVVHIASIAAQLPLLSNPIYCASKHAIVGFVRSLSELDSTFSIRISAVAPGLVRTPLWTDNPDKLQYVDESQDVWVTAREVAEAMLKLAEDPEMPGGTILEVGQRQTRIVPLFGNEGPSGRGHATSNISKGNEEVIGLLGQENWGKLVKQ